MTSGSSGDTARGGGGAISITADAVARLVQGTLVGDPAIAVSAIAPLDRASASDLSFLAAARYAPLLAASRAGIVLISPELADTPGAVGARIVVPKPHDALVTLLPRFYATPERRPGVDATARIGRGARLGESVTIDAYAVIGDGAVIGDRAWIGPQCVVGAGVEVGDDSRLFPSVTLYPGTRLGKRVSVHAGARLGSDGFGYVYRDDAHQKIPHVGRCLIGDDVEIGANTTIDRGSVDDTVIGAGSKIDNLVHLGHNVRVGRLCLIMAQVGAAGSTHLDDGAVVGGQAGFSGHLTVGKGARIAGRAGVIADVPAGETWSGYPARPHRESLRAHAALFKLAGMMKRIEKALGGAGGDTSAGGAEKRS